MVLEELDKRPKQTFFELHPYIRDVSDFRMLYNFLYHGIRFGGLKTFEKILKAGAILAGKYTDERYSDYIDNCNEGLYVSLLEYSSEAKQEFEVFIKNNITFIISPFLEDAYKTIYINYSTWDYINNKCCVLKNRYSYAHGEYQVKDAVSLKDVLAVGIPYTDDYGLCNDLLLKKVQELMKKYNFNVPIVDINRYNNLLVPKESMKRERVK